MRLQEALNKSVEEFGFEILNEPRLINIINDYHGFDDMPANQFIFKTMYNDGVIKQLIKNKYMSPSDIKQMGNKLNQKYGFSEELTYPMIHDLSCIVLSNLADYTDEETDYFYEDEYNVKYSVDRQKLFGTFRNMDGYIIKPGTITICHYAFSCLKALKSVSLPKSIEFIGDFAFYSCSSLENVLLPKGLKYIGCSAFEYCRSIMNIHLPIGITNIGFRTFAGCTSLKSINIPNNVTYIGHAAFLGCRELVSIKLPQRLVRIDNSTFLGCDSLKSIIIPKGTLSYYEKKLYTKKSKLVEE